jgi:hypothetical protein
MIRKFEEWDLPRAKVIHESSGLDERCFPNLVIKNPAGEEIRNPLFVVREVYESEGTPVLMCFLKMTSEVYLLVDHETGTPQERWEWLKEFKEHIKHEAWRLGLEQMTAWVPRDVEASFEKRLTDLGFVKSPWNSYTLNVED